MSGGRQEICAPRMQRTLSSCMQIRRCWWSDALQEIFLHNDHVSAVIIGAFVVTRASLKSRILRKAAFFCKELQQLIKRKWIHGCSDNWMTVSFLSQAKILRICRCSVLNLMICCFFFVISDSKQESYSFKLLDEGAIWESHCGLWKLSFFTVYWQFIE